MQTIQLQSSILLADLGDPHLLERFLNLGTVRRGQDPQHEELAAIWPYAGPDVLPILGWLGRALRASLCGGEGDQPPVGEINRILALCPVVYQVTERGLAVSPRSAGDAEKLPALGLALLAADAIASGRWPRLKQCAGCDCVFYDTSRNGLRVWCSMDTCGNRAKVSRWRGRHLAERARDSAHTCACAGECRCGARLTTLTAQEAHSDD